MSHQSSSHTSHIQTRDNNDSFYVESMSSMTRYVGRLTNKSRNINILVRRTIGVFNIGKTSAKLVTMTIFYSTN